MQALVPPTYRTLLKAARKIDADPAARCLVSAAPARLYNHEAQQWSELDIAELREWPQARRTVEADIAKVNGGRVWWQPPLRMVGESAEDASARAAAAQTECSIERAVRGKFRETHFTPSNLTTGFAAIKLLTNVLEAAKTLPSPSDMVAAASAPEQAVAKSEEPQKESEGKSEGEEKPQSEVQAPPAPPRQTISYGCTGIESVEEPGSTDKAVILAAHPAMGSVFANTILLVTHLDEGAVALIVNSPFLNVSFDGKKDTIPVWAVVGSSSHQIFTTHLANNPIMLGGPVAGPTAREQAVFVLHCVESVPDSTKIAPGIFMSGDLDALEKALDDGVTSPAEVLVVVGYAGWGKDQLNGEIAQGSWFPVTCDRSDLSAAPAADKSVFTKTAVELFVGESVKSAAAKSAARKASGEDSVSRGGGMSPFGAAKQEILGMLSKAKTQLEGTPAAADESKPTAAEVTEVEVESIPVEDNAEKKKGKGKTKKEKREQARKKGEPSAKIPEPEKVKEEEVVIVKTVSVDDASPTRTPEQVMFNLVFQGNVLTQPGDERRTAQAEQATTVEEYIAATTLASLKKCPGELFAAESWAAFVAGLGPQHERLTVLGTAQDKPPSTDEQEE